MLSGALYYSMHADIYEHAADIIINIKFIACIKGINIRACEP